MEWVRPTSRPNRPSPLARPPDERPLERLPRALVFPNDHAAVTADLHRLDGDFQSHDHDFVEVAVVLAGEGAHASVRGEQTVRAGDAFVLRPGAWHAYRRCRGLEVFNAYLGEELLQRELAWLLEDPALGHLLWSGPRAFDGRGVATARLDDLGLVRARDHLEALHNLARSGDAGSRAARLGRFLLLLSELARGLPADLGGTGRAARPPRAVVEGVRLLEADPAHPWTLAELAGRLNVAPAHLSRLFKAHTGLPPLAYLARWRLERAAALLVRTDRPVSDIGAEVGWFDPNHFARRFRAHFGVSATAYRATAGGRSILVPSWQREGAGPKLPELNDVLDGPSSSVQGPEEKKVGGVAGGDLSAHAGPDLS